jgi:polyvinyl alcohol dehydrogenase (cytochrome)
MVLLGGGVACSTEEPTTMAPPIMGGGGVAPPPGGGGAQAPAGGGSQAPVAGGQATDPDNPTPAAGTGGTPPAGGSGGMAATAGASGEPPAGGSGPTPMGNADWPLMAYDLGSTYFNSAETVLTKENAANLAEAWTADLGGNIYSAPLQVEGKIYAAGPANVRAFDAATGMQLWMTQLTSTSSLSYADGTLYINNSTSQVVALDAATGMQRWSKQPDTQRADGSSSPIPAGDVILIGGSNGGIELGGGSFRGYMAALNRMTGDVLWVTRTVPENAKGASIWSSPSADLAAGRAYGSTGNNYGNPATDTSDSIIAFDLASGEIVWKNQRVQNDTFGGGLGGSGPDSDFGANPVLYEAMVDGVMTKLVAAGTKGGTTHAVRRDDGMLVWTRSLCSGQADGSRGIFVNSTWSGKNMLFACNEGGPATLYALDGATGDVVWMRALTGQVWGRMSAANGVGFVGTGTNLEVFDVDTGAVIKTFPSKGGTVAGTITISNGRVAWGEGLSWSSGRRGTTLHVLETH